MPVRSHAPSLSQLVAVITQLILCKESEVAGPVAWRFSALERILDSQRPSDIFSCCLDLSMVPFEKVLCQIPFSIVTRDGKVPADAQEVNHWLDKGLR